VLQFEAPELREGQLEEHLGGQPSVSRSVDDEQASALEQQMRGAERRGFVARGAPRDVPLEGAMRLRLPLPVDAGTCVSVLAVAHGAVEGVDLVLRDEAGVARSEDLAPTRGAAVQACPRRDGRWTIELSSSGGPGRAEVAVMVAQQSEVGAETSLWWGARPAPERPRLTGRVFSRGRLAPGEVRSAPVPTPPGACVRVDAAGDPRLGAIELTPASGEADAARAALVRGVRLCRTRGAPAPRVRVSARGPGAYRLLIVSGDGD